MHHDDHDHAPEPIPGLPDYLPEGEEILWQGSPDQRTFLLRVLHLRKIAVYFAVILVAAALARFASGAAFQDTLMSLASLGTTALLPLGLLWVVGRSMQRSTIYTITTRRVVMRFGVALPITVNLPYSQINGADARLLDDSTGDITLSLGAHRGTNYVVLWPHARPWEWMKPEPALRCVPNASEVARLLGNAWSEATGVDAAPKSAASTRKTPSPTGLKPAHR